MKRYTVRVKVDVIEVVDKPEGGAYDGDNLVAREMNAVTGDKIEAMRLADSIIGTARRNGLY